MAQLVNHNDVFTFRPWNPKDIKAPIGGEQDVTEASCPCCCFTCADVEKRFKTLYKEQIDDIRTDGKTASEIFSEMIDTYKPTPDPVGYRYSSWFLSLFGHTMLFFSMMRRISYIPLAGYLMAKVDVSGLFLFCIVWCTALHFFIRGIAWV